MGHQRCFECHCNALGGSIASLEDLDMWCMWHWGYWVRLCTWMSWMPLIPSYSTCTLIIPVNPLTSVKPHAAHGVCVPWVHTSIYWAQLPCAEHTALNPKWKHTHSHTVCYQCPLLCWAVLFESVSIISLTHGALATAATSAANIQYNHRLEIIRPFCHWESSLMLQWLGAAFVCAPTKEEQ